MSFCFWAAGDDGGPATARRAGSARQPRLRLVRFNELGDEVTSAYKTYISDF